LIALVDLLADPEHAARAGAARAIACTEPLAAEAVLRTKVLLGDDEPDVIGECLRGLLDLEPDASPPFVARLLNDANPELAELAALALGESRLDAAVAPLRAQWEQQPLKRPRDLILLRAATLARSDYAFDWLLQLIREADTATARFLIEELAVYRGNQRLAARLKEQVGSRGEPALSRAFATHWPKP
jgi:HEAT repeat protein